jgi:nucleoside-diphosphate-sugar epimerase
MARTLVTGAAGFIGSSLVAALVERGETVRALDNFSTGKRSNLAPYWHRDNLKDVIELHECDLRDADAVAAACDGVEIILHQGALPSVPRSVKAPRPSHESNIDGTFNLLEGARAAGVRRIVYAGSSSAYGNQPGFPRVETMPPQPLSPYAVQKLMGQFYMQSYWHVYGIETVCLRYFNIFGPRQVPDSPYSGVMAKFILQMLRGETPTILGDGEQARDFTYIANAVDANLRAAAAPAELVAGKVFNIACGERHTLNETYAVIAKLLGFPHPPQYEPERVGDVKVSLADISAAREAFGYEPLVRFEEGLRRTVEWYKEEFLRASNDAATVESEWKGGKYRGCS